MDQVHIHLLITHLPIFGSILGGLVLAHRISSKSDQTKISVISIIGLYLTIKKSSLSSTIAILTLVVALISLGLVASTGYLGGQIRHTEIGIASSAQGSSEEPDD